VPKPPKTIEELFDRTLALLPNSVIETDEETGELIIRSGLLECEDGELEALEEIGFDDEDLDELDDDDNDEEEV
jgi:hypothetical protein